MKKELTNRKIRHYEEVKPAEYRKEGKMIYRISLENIREQIEDVLILDKWKMTKNDEQIKYLTEKRHYRKGQTREEAYKWAKPRYEALINKDSKDKVVFYPERDFILIRNWLKFLYYAINIKFEDGSYDYKYEVLSFYLKKLLMREKSDVEDLFDVSESIVGITLEDIRERFQLWMEGKITRTEVEYWSDRRNICIHHYDDVEFYPIEKEYLYQKWIETLSMFALGGEGDYFYTDEGLKKMYYELCEDIKKADEKFEQEIKKIYK